MRKLAEVTVHWNGRYFTSVGSMSIALRCYDPFAYKAELPLRFVDTLLRFGHAA